MSTHDSAPVNQQADSTVATVKPGSRFRKWLWPGLFCAALLPAFFDWRLWVLIRKPRETAPPVIMAEPLRAEMQLIHKEVAAAWARIESALEKDYPQYLEHLAGPPDEREIIRIETELGYRFPPHYRASLMIHDGFATHDLQPWQPLLLPLPLESALRGTLSQYSSSRGTGIGKQRWHPRLFLISFDGVLNLETGEIFTPFRFDDPPEAKNTTKFLNDFAKDLELAADNRQKHE